MTDRRRARVRRVNAKRPPDADVRIVDAGEDRSDLAVEIIVRWLDERAGGGKN